MNHFERIKAALNSESVDRVPVSVWSHLPEYDQNPHLLARKQVELAKKFDFDFIKLMPFGLYGVEDYGAEVRYFSKQNEPAVLETPGIQKATDWLKIKSLPGTFGTYGKQVKLAEYVGYLSAGELPFIQTIFNPLTTAFKLAGGRLLLDIKEHPDYVHEALKAITQTTINFVEENIKVGVDGFFIATQTATSNLFTRDEYLEFGQHYDLQVIDSFKSKTWFNVAHIHGDKTYFDLIADYPVQALNWHDRTVYPSLYEARKLTNKALIGGLNELPEGETNGDSQRSSILVTGDTNQIRDHVTEAIKSVKGKGLIIGPGCVASENIPDENLYTIRASTKL